METVEFIKRNLSVLKKKRACVIGINKFQDLIFVFFIIVVRNICLRLRFNITHFGFNLKNL
ncbi:unnamed protein product [Brassica oleracea]